MKKNMGRFFFILSFFVLSLHVKTQEKYDVHIPETYELSNIILALTDYGISDKGEVQKNTDYYQSVLSYFESVRNHPLLDSVNYSREKWDYYLAFRTDAIAYSFGQDNRLVKNFEFQTQPNISPFEDNIDLVNDFIQKSEFRKFFKHNKKMYDNIVSNYNEYNYVNETISFLDSIANKTIKSSSKVILSPLVYRMNAHRIIGDSINVDFPSATEDFVNGVSDDNNIQDRLNSNHLFFTEKDHEYINPITDKHIELVNANYDTSCWDKNSGYLGADSFNEYMTWAVYDLFLEKKFPHFFESLSTQWQFQNASRGFFAQNLFSIKVRELYNQHRGSNIEDIYEPLLTWMHEIQENINLPTIVEHTFNESNMVSIVFSEKMKVGEPFECILHELENGKPTRNNEVLEMSNYNWSDDKKKLNFTIPSIYKECAIVFNWWGVTKPLISDSGVFLKASSYIKKD